MKTLLQKYLPVRRPDDGTGSDTVGDETATAATPADVTTNDNLTTNDNTPEAGLETATEVEQPAEEFDIVDINGKQYQIPKELKRHVMLDADYTQKSQENAKLTKELSERQARLEEQSKANDEILDLRSDARKVNSELERYAQYTAAQWEALEAEDPQGYNKHRFYLQSLKEQRLELKEALSQAEAKFSQEAKSRAEKSIEETQAHAMKIKGWTPQMDAEVVEFAKSKGFTPEQVASLMSPAFYDTLRFAKIGEESAKRATAPNLPQVPAQPLSVVGAKKNPPNTFDPASASMEDYAADFKKREKARLAARG